MRRALLALAFLVAMWVPEPPARGGVRQWDNECEPNVDWDKVCDGVSTTNWDQDPNLPQPSDSVNVLAKFGQTRLHSSFELQGVTVGGSLLIDGGDLLTVHDNSTISNLSVSGGGIQALDDATVTLLGNTSLIGSLKGDGTAGQFQIVDQYFGGGVFELGAQVTTLGTATVSSNMSMHHEGTEWINQGNVTLSANITTSAADTADIINQNNFTVVGGQQVDISVDFINQGTLELQESGTILALKSHVSKFLGGTVSVPDGTTLKLQALNGLPQVHEFGTSPTLTGAGWIDVIGNDYNVTAPLTTAVGVGAAVGGTGGFHLTDATLFVSPGIDIRNTGRFSFVGGTIAGGGKFINESEAFTTSGSATFGIHVLNELNFSVLCCSIIIGGGKNFENDFDVLVHGEIVIQSGSYFGNVRDAFDPDRNGLVRLEAANARISGAGEFINVGGLLRLTVGAQEGGYVSSRFVNDRHLLSGAQGRVHAQSGTLVFEGDVVNLDLDGVLTGGRWEGGPDGIIDFPRNVTTLGSASPGSFTTVEFDRPQPDFNNLSLIRKYGFAIFNGGQNFLDALEIRGHLQGTNLTVLGRPSIVSGGFLLVDADGGFTTPEETDLGDGADSIIPELASETPGPEHHDGMGSQGPLPTNPLLITAKLNNRGRVLPGDRQDIGTLEVQGDYEQYSMGRLHIETVSGGNSDLLDLVGDVILGGTLELGRIADDDPEVGLVYTILTTTGSLTGTFSSVDTIDTVQVIYNAQSVDVVFDEVNPVPVFADDFESGDTSAWSSSVP